jgi:hypothetical protein
MRSIYKVIFLCFVCISLYGCAAGSATAGYAVKSGTADDVSSKCRQSIIDDVMQRLNK